MMYRVLAIVTGALALGACSSSSDWLDGLKPGPSLDTVRFESEPPGAEAKTSNGQTCRTPCALALPTDAPLTVTFSLTGYQPESETVEPIAQTGSPPQLRPNPVLVELTPAPPQPKPAAKPRSRRGRPRQNLRPQSLPPSPPRRGLRPPLPQWRRQPTSRPPRRRGQHRRGSKQPGRFSTIKPRRAPGRLRFARFRRSERYGQDRSRLPISEGRSDPSCRG